MFSLRSAIVLSFLVFPSLALGQVVDDEVSLREALTRPVAKGEVLEVVFANGVLINLSAPVFYRGEGRVHMIGNGATINAASIGGFSLNEDGEAIGAQAAVNFNTSSAIHIRDLTIVDSASGGLLLRVPGGSHGDDAQLYLERVAIHNSALHGLYIDDNEHDLDEGDRGSAIGISLRLISSEIVGNGIGAVDADGIRIDERGLGSIAVYAMDSRIDGNGGDGIELDEAGSGDVSASLFQVSLNGNGFYSEADWDDGFDVDESGDGDLLLDFVDLEVSANREEGIDVDESGRGDVIAKFNRVIAHNNYEEALKIDEDYHGDIVVDLKHLTASGNGDDGLHLVELGQGMVKGDLHNVTVTHSGKYALRAHQWLIEDELRYHEPLGTLSMSAVYFGDNAKGDLAQVENIELR